MGLQAPEGLLAIHTNMPAAVPADVDQASLAEDPPPSGLSAEERRAYEELIRTYGQVEYARFMAARPQTLYGIGDSPVGLAAWQPHQPCLITLSRRQLTGAVAGHEQSAARAQQVHCPLILPTPTHSRPGRQPDRPARPVRLGPG
jgi:hypothetical protein